MRAPAIVAPFLLLATAVAAATSHAPVQDSPEPEVIPDDPACPRCEVVLRRVAVLGRGDTVPLDHVVQLARDGRGRYYAAPALPRFRAAVYGADGAFAGYLGRDGDGPGELRFAQFVAVGPGDTVSVVDPLRRRLTVYSPEHAFVRTVPLDFGMVDDAVRLPDGGHLLWARIATPERAGYPLHRVDAGWKLRRSFGSDGVLLPDRRADQMRAIAPAGPGRVWSARRNRYQVELWSADGAHRRTLVRSPAWFQPWERRSPLPEDVARPAPLLRAVRQDAQGLLWVFVTVPDARWRAARAAPGGRREMGIVPRAEQDRYLDTMIEVLDPASGRVVARSRSGRHLGDFASGDPHLYSTAADAEGNEFLNVWTVELRRPREEGR